MSADRPSGPVLAGLGLLAAVGVGAAAVSYQAMPTPQPPEPIPVEDLQAAPEPPPEAPPAPPVARTAPEAPTPVDTFVEGPQGLRWADLTVGEGALVEDGLQITAQWVLWTADGQLVDGTYVSGRPFRYVAGRKQVLPGWALGSQGMRVGGRRQIHLPAALGFGANGRKGVPPQTDLVLELQIDAIAPPLTVPEAPADLPDSAYTTTASGLRWAELSPGTGTVGHEGQVAELHYTMWLEDGTRIDSSLERGAPVRLRLGHQQAAMQGWIEGAALMSVGATWQLILPPELAYDDHGRGSVIPPNATLILQQTLLALDEAP